MINVGAFVVLTAGAESKRRKWARRNTVHLIRFFDVWPEESAFWLAREICARDSLTFFVSRLLGSNVPFDQGAEYRGFLRAIAPSSESTF